MTLVIFIHESASNAFIIATWNVDRRMIRSGGLKYFKEKCEIRRAPEIVIKRLYL